MAVKKFFNFNFNFCFCFCWRPDDAMAILLAFNSPELDVIGLTTIFGNVQTTMATYNALHLVCESTHFAKLNRISFVIDENRVELNFMQ